MKSQKRTQKDFTDDRCVITIEVDKTIIENFRVAVSKKHRGRTKGHTYDEYNNALEKWTSVMNGEVEIVKTIPPKHAPIFSSSENQENR
jgi:hypothetical protein